ncbi:hypothetical protein [Methylococcus capsulatus]|uniref:hypothetical protein n=1 Tax=Methylococcus capsulatus TaxID=414 RepID=UPI0002E617C2|nr:hypothetical protein [Methylococcus capsulatus]
MKQLFDFCFEAQSYTVFGFGHGGVLPSAEIGMDVLALTEVEAPDQDFNTMTFPGKMVFRR